MLGPRLVVDLDPDGWAPIFTIQGARLAFIGREADDAIYAALHRPPLLVPTKRSNGRQSVLRRHIARARDCYWCGCRLDDTNRRVDHRIPLARGGMHSPLNVVASCQRCNDWRGSDMPELLVAEGYR